MVVVGIFVLASPVIVHYDVNYTAEQSYVWLGLCNVTDLFPGELLVYADGVGIEDGDWVSGVLDPDTHEVDQDYYIVEEAGVSFNITWNFTWVEYTCPEHFHWTGRYEAPANRYFDWYAWNWTDSTWVYVGTGSPDVVASAVDGEEILDSGCTTDFINIDTLQIIMKMDTENSGQNGEIYTDQIFLHTFTDAYVIDNKIVNCSRDQFNTTYDYSGETLPDNDNLLFGILLVFLGLFSLAVGAISVRE